MLGASSNSEETHAKAPDIGYPKVTSIILPEKIEIIASGAFESCYDLTSITIPASVTTIEDHTFLHAAGLTSVTIPESVTSIGNDAFWMCSIETITFEHTSGTISIGVNAFNSTADATFNGNWSCDGSVVYTKGTIKIDLSNLAGIVDTETSTSSPKIWTIS